MKKAIEQEYNFHKYLNLIRIGNKNDNQKRTLANINIFYNARDNAIQFIKDYGGMILETKNLAIEESLLNEIRQIVYSLYRSKEITKKVCNNIINSIKV